jgi:hypothetical protein
MPWRTPHMQQVDAGLENMERAATSLFDEFS